MTLTPRVRNRESMPVLEELLAGAQLDDQARQHVIEMLLNSFYNCGMYSECIARVKELLPATKARHGDTSKEVQHLIALWGVCRKSSGKSAMDCADPMFMDIYTALERVLAIGDVLDGVHRDLYEAFDAGDLVRAEELMKSGGFLDLPQARKVTWLLQLATEYILRHFDGGRSLVKRDGVDKAPLRRAIEVLKECKSGQKGRNVHQGSLLGVTYRLLGIAHWDMGEHDKGMQYLEKAKKLFLDENHHACLEATNKLITGLPLEQKSAHCLTAGDHVSQFLPFLNISGGLAAGISARLAVLESSAKQNTAPHMRTLSAASGTFP